MPFTGRTTRTGNSKGFRFESALFAAHPEFASGAVEAHVIAPGRLLVRTLEDSVQAEESDPVLEAFLAFLAYQMREHPQLVRPLTAKDLHRIEELVDGVEYDPDERLEEDFELP